MKKPKRLKKCLSFFLAFLMFFTSITVGIEAFAAQLGTSHKNWTNGYLATEWANASLDGLDNLSTDNAKDRMRQAWMEIANRIANDAGEDNQPIRNDGYALYDKNAYQWKANNTLLGMMTNGTTNNATSSSKPSSGYFRGVTINDNTDNGDVYAVVKNVYLTQLIYSNYNNTGGSDRRNVWQSCSRWLGGILGQDTDGEGKGLNWMGSSLPINKGELTRIAHYIMGTPLKDTGSSISELSYHISSTNYPVNTVVALGDAYALWNSYGNDLTNLPTKLTTKKIWSYTCTISGSAGSNKRGRVSNIAEGDDTTVDRVFEQIVVNADELKAFNEFFSSGYDAESAKWKDSSNHLLRVLQIIQSMKIFLAINRLRL